jgi:hypothetical protein
MIWSSWGNPPHAAAAGREDAWQHDVYCSWLNGAGPRIAPRVLAGGPGAQEPASSAVNSAGSLLITCEDARDGEDSLQQTAGLWDARGNLIRDFPLVIDDEGH